MTITVIIFLIIASFFIIYSIQRTEIKNLRKSNREYLQEVSVLHSRQALSLKQLKSYLTQDPIGAFQLLKAHVGSAEKAASNNR